MMFIKGWISQCRKRETEIELVNQNSEFNFQSLNQNSWHPSIRRELSWLQLWRSLVVSQQEDSLHYPSWHSSQWPVNQSNLALEWRKETNIKSKQTTKMITGFTSLEPNQTSIIRTNDSYIVYIMFVLKWKGHTQWQTGKSLFYIRIPKCKH